jgi:hypothetical protein
MKKSRFADEQIIAIPCEHEAGVGMVGSDLTIRVSVRLGRRGFGCLRLILYTHLSNNPDPISVIERFERRIDDSIIFGEAREDFDIGADVLADLHVFKHNGLIGVDSRDLDAVLPKDQGCGREAQRFGIGFDVEVNLGEGSRPKFALGVVGLQLNQSGARIMRDRV